MELTNKDTITSLELLEQINFFRKKERFENQNDSRFLKDCLHDSLLKIIRDEFEEEISLGELNESTYKSRGKEYPMFILTISKAKQVLVRESKYVRKAVIHKLEELENKIKVPTTFKEALKLAIEQHEKIEKQQLVIQEKSKIIKEK